MPLSNEVRIIGGKWKRRKLAFPNRTSLRPTLDRVRVTLFNWLVAHVQDAVCLDLYAGSGALGFEALSRGAREVTLVDSDPAAVRGLRASRERLGADHAHIVRSAALPWLRRASGSFDLVFLDPPFAGSELSGVLEVLRTRPLLEDGALVYAETSIRSEPELRGFRTVKEGKAGETRYFLLAADEQDAI